MVQLVHYPCFCYIEPAIFPEFHRFHSKRITLIAAPLMLAELCTAIILVFNPGFIPCSLSLPALFLIIAIFAETAFRVVKKLPGAGLWRFLM